MIVATTLLKDLKKLLRVLETDIRDRVEGSPVEEELRAEWQATRDAKRTAQAFPVWLDEEVTQAAVHWILGCVFLRFVEDNRLVDRPWLSGPKERLDLARDRHEAWFRANPTGEERDFLLACFAEAAELPGLGALFNRRHNPLWRLPVSGDGAIALREFWQRRDPDTAVLAHDFTDPDLGTRFLGDLYQDLSEAARKRYALLQTPEFVEEFILDRTLDPAMREFGFREVRLIDPTCGSGHFLLGAFRRLFDLWIRNEPGRNPRDCAQKALDAVCGVDINPFAVAIARFRLLVAALTACGITTLRGVPDFKIAVAVGDSLLHGRRFMDVRGWQMSFEPQGGLAHVSFEEDREALDLILGRQYHAVVGNPPYITVKDKALNQAYRERYFTCHMKFSLGVPFAERFFDLAIEGGEGGDGGYIGTITTNSFMKREFGKKLIENFFPSINLTHVIDTSGAHIPGHGTPTVVLFGRNQRPTEEKVRVVVGLQAEATKPVDPTSAPVWRSLVSLIDVANQVNEFASCSEEPRALLGAHPWSMGGSDSNSIKFTMEGALGKKLEEAVSIRKYQTRVGGRIVWRKIEEVGFASFTGQDETFLADRATWRRVGVSCRYVKTLVSGDAVRDWGEDLEVAAFAPYDENFQLLTLQREENWSRRLWICRTPLFNIMSFGGKTRGSLGDPWWGWYRWVRERYPVKDNLTFAFVATHNHFSVDRGDAVFNRTAPIIKLKNSKGENLSHAVIGLLNSSAGCFWMKQTFMDRGGGGIGGGLATEAWERFYEHDGTKLQSFPLAEPYPTDLAATLDSFARELTDKLPKAVLARVIPTRVDLDAAKAHALSIRRRMIALQEELDWRCYRLYALLDEVAEQPEPPEVDLGERAFEIVMARKMNEGRLETTWFERHGSTPVTEVPARWPADYRALVERRIALIEENRWINLVERPEYKRRWQWDDQGFDAGWTKREKAALKEWLLDRLEDGRYWSGEPALTSVSRLADMARQDADFMAVAELYTGRPDFDVQPLVAELVAAESVPFLPVLRYTGEGLRKRREWEATWDLQRREDAIDARAELPEGDPNRLTPDEAKAMKAREVGDIPVPPKYKTADFQKTDYWRLRGGLDVPKERFVSYPFAERDADGSLVVAWAGYDHLQQAAALASYYFAMKEQEGWGTERLKPLLAGIQELVPWLVQWHNEYSPDFGVGLGDYYRSFVSDEARALGLAPGDLREWIPPAKPGTRRGRRKGS